MSISGGIHKSIANALDLELESFQIFSRNQRQWSSPPLPAEEVSLFRSSLKGSGLSPPLVHASYLLNLCSPDRTTLSRSISLLVDELQRSALIGAGPVVLHPGSHMGKGEERGTKGISESIVRAFLAFDRASTGAGDGLRPPMLLLETTAGQGTNLGHSPSQLSRIIDGCKDAGPIGICFDTCHVHAAGYDISTIEGYDAMLDSFSEHLPLSIIKAVHLNDSVKPPGSRVDRHANIGKGCMGLQPFRSLLNDARFMDLPMVLETPGGNEGYRTDLRLLRSLLGT